jgi:hypothetical protein
MYIKLRYKQRLWINDEYIEEHTYMEHGVIIWFILNHQNGDMLRVPYVEFLV